MIAVDTNILVRLFTNDDKEQAQKSVELINNNQVFISNTVLLETEWVLRYTYNLKRKAIYEIFESLLTYSNIMFENRGVVHDVIEFAKQGFDFADVLHVSIGGCCGVNKFFTFDKKLVNKAKRNKFIPEVQSP